MTREDYLAAWSRLHGGYDVGRSRAVRGWLTLTYVLARPLVATRVPPDAVTWAGVPVGLGVVGLAAAGDRWAVVAAGLVLVVALLDALDGAVAVLARRTTAWGFVLDSLVDRATEVLFLLALWLLGAPGWLCVAAGTISGLHEYARARAAAAGVTEIGVVTVAERPTRVVVTVLGLLSAGVWPAAAGDWALGAAAAWLAVGSVGLGQLLVAVRRHLHAPTPP